MLQLKDLVLQQCSRIRNRGGDPVAKDEICMEKCGFLVVTASSARS